jgi:3-oxoacyl-[acyl-carrier-protein] synthase III
MRYENVCIESMGYVIPDHVVLSTWFEEQIAPLYEQFGIPIGRLEQLTGIHERRWWDEGFPVSEGAAMAGERAIEKAQIDRRAIQCLINASVCRDYIEPATAVIVHDRLGLSPTAMNLDVSNACLGFLNGMTLVANMIELGQIDAGMVVAAESIREGQLKTIERLLAQPTDKQTLWENTATFTLGSGAVAMILSHKTRFPSRNGRRPRLLGGAVRGHTEHNGLCVAQADWMRTNSHDLLIEGMKVIALNWVQFKQEMGWDNGSVDKLFTHQVSEKQRQIGLETLGLGKGRTSERDIDYPTLGWLGNIASVSAPISMAIADDEGFVDPGDRVCLLGVGSGVNSIILGIEW